MSGASPNWTSVTGASIPAATQEAPSCPGSGATSVTSWPASASRQAHESPMTPPPTTSTRATIAESLRTLDRGRDQGVEQPRPDLVMWVLHNKGDPHGCKLEFTRFSGLRRRQPPVRDYRRADQVPPAGVQGRHRLRRRPRPHEDRGQGPDQRLHPQPHLRPGGPAGGPGGVLQARQPRREVLPGDHRPGHRLPARLPRRRPPSRAARRAGHLLRHHAAHPGQPGRGTHAGRSRAVRRRHPRPQPLDARGVALRLQGPHLLDADHHPGAARQGARGARLPRGQRRPGHPHAAGAGLGLPGPALVRPPRVRPLLVPGRGVRDPGRDPRLGHRATSVTSTNGRVGRPRPRPSPSPSRSWPRCSTASATFRTR